MNKQTSSAPESGRRFHCDSLALQAQTAVSATRTDPKANHPIGLTRAPTSFVSLKEVCMRLKRSSSWVYENIIADSDKKLRKKKPPHPFDWLPPRAIPGKGLWVESEFEEWLRGVIARSREASHVVID